MVKRNPELALASGLVAGIGSTWTAPLPPPAAYFARASTLGGSITGTITGASAAPSLRVTRLLEDGLTATEVDDSRRYLIGSMPRALETNAAIALFLQNAEFFGLGTDYDLRMPELLRAVTLDEVNAVARRVIDPSRATLVIAGPYQES